MYSLTSHRGRHFSGLMLRPTTYNLQGRKEPFCSLSALSPGGWNLQDYLTQSEVRLLATRTVWGREGMNGT